MRNKYVCIEDVTKEALDAVKVGDLVRVNEWKAPMRVVGATANYFMMVRKQFGELVYSVCEKKPWGGIRRNAMRGGMFHCGDDNWIGCSVGFPKDVSNQAEVNAYLDEFEKGYTELSERRAVPISSLHVKAS